jgi:hypothetical protein
LFYHEGLAMRIPNMRPGQIMLWYGILSDVPSGWHICDGKLNTPDLRNRFVIGAGSTYEPDASGGSNAHGHNYIGPLHTHTFSAGPNVLSGTMLDSTTEQSRMVGETDWESHRPPYKALVWIMKVN